MNLQPLVSYPEKTLQCVGLLLNRLYSIRFITQQTIDELRQQMNELKQMLLTSTNVSGAKSNTEINGAYLLQNSPNPTNTNAIIRCYVPASVKKAQLLVYNRNGRLMKTFPLSNGMNDVTVTAEGLSSGQYSYTLLTDGKKVDAKSMAITK